MRMGDDEWCRVQGGSLVRRCMGGWNFCHCKFSYEGGDFLSTVCSGQLRGVQIFASRNFSHVCLVQFF